jgi:hypothetical protein
MCSAAQKHFLSDVSRGAKTLPEQFLGIAKKSDAAAGAIRKKNGFGGSLQHTYMSRFIIVK